MTDGDSGKVHMKFLFEGTIRGVWLDDRTPLSFNIGDAELIQVNVGSKARNDHPSDIPRALIRCMSEAHPSPAVMAVFEKIEKDDVLKDGQQWSTKYKGVDGRDISIPQMAGFPDHFRAFCDTVHGRLRRCALAVSNILIWRSGVHGHHQPLAESRVQWSRDGTLWHPLPRQWSVRGQVSRPASIDPQQGQDILRLVSAGVEGPLHHELFREAWGQRGENLRSALVVGVSAAEVAVRMCCSDEARDEVGWLIENSQLPPLNRIVCEYMYPRLARMMNADIAPSNRVRETLKKVVAMRNEAAHRGRSIWRSQKVEECLLCIQDVLYLVDIGRGHRWAYVHISEALRGELPGLAEFCMSAQAGRA